MIASQREITSSSLPFVVYPNADAKDDDDDDADDAAAALDYSSGFIFLITRQASSTNKCLTFPEYTRCSFVVPEFLSLRNKIMIRYKFFPTRPK